jgi:plastocyanin
MVLKAVIIVVSIAAIVLASIIIGGAIIAVQVLENDPNIRNEMRQWLAGGDSEQDSQKRTSSSSSSLTITEEGKVVSIIGNSGSNSYNPNPIEIKVGDTVTWINNDSSPHTVTTSSSKSNFDSDVLRRGETFSFTFDREGEYPYFCTLHPSMVGTIVVLPPEGG